MDSNAISTGSPPRPSRPEAGALGVRRALAAAAVIAALAAGGVAAQVRLLEPERAFAYSVQAVDDRTIEARFAIADGYYLYREKMRFTVETAALKAAPALPPGKVKVDEFFGKVETYRGKLAVRLPLDGPQPGQKVTVKAESQGCADAGVCYPPQVQTLTVTMPVAGARPGAPVVATPAKKSWFN